MLRMGGGTEDEQDWDPSPAPGVPARQPEICWVGGTGKKKPPFLRLRGGGRSDLWPPKRVWVTLGCPTAPRWAQPGPTAAPRGARRGAAHSGLGRGRRAHLHFGRAVRPLRSVTNRMSPPPGPQPLPSPLLRLLLLVRHLRPAVRAPSRG